MWFINTVEYHSSTKGMQYWHMTQYGWIFKTWEEANHKRPHITCFHLYEMSRTDRILETQKNSGYLVLGEGWKEKRSVG